MITLTWPALACVMAFAASMGLTAGLVIAIRAERAFSRFLKEHNGWLDRHTEWVAKLVSRSPPHA